MAVTINQSRAVKYHLDQHPELTIAMGVAGISAGFKHKETKEVTFISFMHLEQAYNNAKKAKEEVRKKMKKGLTDARRKPEPKRVRPSRGGAQSTFTGDGWG